MQGTLIGTVVRDTDGLALRIAGKPSGLTLPLIGMGANARKYRADVGTPRYADIGRPVYSTDGAWFLGARDTTPEKRHQHQL